MLYGRQSMFFDSKLEIQNCASLKGPSGKFFKTVRFRQISSSQPSWVSDPSIDIKGKWPIP